MDRRTARTRVVNRVYLDHAATTPARPEAVAAMLPLLGAGGYNASSIHAEGRLARAELDRARVTVARAIGALPREIVFTGGGSESVMLALAGAARAVGSRGRHAITCVTEHHAVAHAFNVLERDGWSVTRLGVDGDGRVDPADFERALRPQTTLASIMLANNEIGTIAPVAELARIARAAGVVFHTDAIAAPNVLAVDVDELGVDLLSLAGHKFYGPKGVGVLYVRSGTPVVAQVVGGPQEHGLRAGTENVAGIAGLAVALDLARAERMETATRLAALRHRLEAGIMGTIPEVRVNAAGAARVAGVSSISFGGLTSDALVIGLDLAGFAVSAGSACAAGALEPSHVIAALGLPDAAAAGVVRFSLGRLTTAEEIERILEILPQLVNDMRRVGAVV